MILNIYAFKDNKLRCYTQPFYNDVPVENVAVGTTRAILGAKDPNIYKSKVLYLLGTFDDASGKIISQEPELVLDCDEVLGGLENGK